MKQFFQDFCQAVIKIDPSIRFIGIADGHGRILATAERPGLEPLLNQQETAICNNRCDQTVHSDKVAAYFGED